MVGFSKGMFKAENGGIPERKKLSDADLAGESQFDHSKHHSIQVVARANAMGNNAAPGF